MSTRVVIVEDHQAFRSSVELVLDTTPGFTCAGAYGSVESMWRDMRDPRSMAASWSLVLMDLDLPGAGGIEGIRSIKAHLPDTRVVVCTIFEDPATVLDAIGAGADGYLLKGIGPDELIEQLRLVESGGASLSAKVSRTLLDFVKQHRTRPGVSTPSRLDLTAREREVLRCLVEGQSYKEAAHELQVSVNTVRFHIRGLYKKLQVNNAAEAVSRAVRERLV